MLKNVFNNEKQTKEYICASKPPRSAAAQMHDEQQKN
jgi:hypothetical protein